MATLRSQWLGQRLRDLRDAAGITLADAAEYLGVKNTSTMSRYETGIIPLRWTDVDALLTMYGVADQGLRSELISLAKEAWRKGWWDEYRDVVGDKRYLDAFWLEGRARHIRTFNLGFIHGLLETPGYMGAIFRNDSSFDEAAAARAVELRLARQRILDTGQASMTAIISELVLRQRIGSPAIMREQLTHLLTLSERDSITIRVLDFDATVYHALAGAFTLFDLGEPFTPVAYVENLAGCLYVESPAVERYLGAYDEIEKAALTPSESARVIRQACEVWK
ncbi:helix-turn-helix domain-containing protein [Nocardia uniformis]|uniref:Helix-turn-helix domain-containing protein n=1 Tax=Nocardia uniformis TaxID=53432 RepID=A0A849CDH8_9NOCA|nr:helix-turn-helix transcriptional regulator [Nocardia uniformis]NNH74217.1 helix-turn-helix domain-containing protein [Nocardia uniformis]